MAMCLSVGSHRAGRPGLTAGILREQENITSLHEQNKTQFKSYNK